jgi:guanylate kinase
MGFPFPTNEPALVLIVSGPAGSGKTTLCERLVASDPTIKRAVTCTTRVPRAGEVDGEDYYFFDERRFAEAVERGEFLEHAWVHGSRYGTLKREIEEKLSQRYSVLLNVDVQGAAALRAAAEETPLLRGRLVSLFVLPPSVEVLRERMLGRGADDPASIETRLRTAEEEMREWPKYDYCIRTGSKAEDYQQLHSIWVAERRRVARLLAAPG